MIHSLEKETPFRIEYQKAASMATQDFEVPAYVDFAIIAENWEAYQCLVKQLVKNHGYSLRIANKINSRFRLL